MSISRLPRLYFNGNFSWNPSTNNNDDYSQAGAGDPNYDPVLYPFDPAAAEPRWAWLAKQSYNGAPVTDENFREWSWADAFDLGNDAHGNPREMPPSEWNFFGGMECGFVTDEFPVLEQPDVFSKPAGGTAICTYTLDGSVQSEDPAVGLELQFNVAPPVGPFGASAKLIDVNPQSPFTTQLFADDFRLGDGTNGFSAPIVAPMQSRWINFDRNYNGDPNNELMIAGIASVAFQCTMQADAIDWGESTGESAVLAALHESAQAGAGLMLRMTNYDTLYFNGEYFGHQNGDQFPAMMKMRDLYAQYFDELERYRAGLRQDAPPAPCNRAYSSTVGWIGTWQGDEFINYPGGRLLTPTVLPLQSYEPTGDDAPAPVHPHAAVPPGHAKGYKPFGPLTAQRDENFTRVTVDLSSTIPELDRSGVFAPFGPIELGISIGGTYHSLVTVLDDSSLYQPHYEVTAGIIDIPVSALGTIDGAPLTVEQFDENSLVLKCTSSTPEDDGGYTDQRVVALSETGLNAQTATRGLYVDEPDPSVPGPTTTFHIDIKDRNAKLTQPAGLVLVQVDSSFKVVSGDERLVEISYRPSGGDWIDVDCDTIIDASSGVVEVGLRGCTGPNATTTGALPKIFFVPVASDHLPPGLGPDSPISGSEVTTQLLKSYDGNPTDGYPLGNPTLIMSMGFAAVRLWPYHRASLAQFEEFLAGMPSVDETNNWVFSHIYKTFHLMYPVMDFINTPQRFQAWRGRVLEVTKPDAFWTAGYMPPTRTLSGPQRSILERYDQYISGGVEAGTT